jgi:hypothetical protein
MTTATRLRGFSTGLGFSTGHLMLGRRARSRAYIKKPGLKDAG